MDDFVIRVDLASDGAKKRDQSLGVFVGNLPFAIEENDVWKHFAKCGEIQDVRIVRDSATGIGKGFGYVNFQVRYKLMFSKKKITMHPCICCVGVRTNSHSRMGSP